LCGQLDPKASLLPFLRSHLPGVPHDFAHFDQDRIVAAPEIQPADLSSGNDEDGA
jgi:hypothetical protein